MLRNKQMKLQPLCVLCGFSTTVRLLHDSSGNSKEWVTVTLRKNTVDTVSLLTADSWTSSREPKVNVGFKRRFQTNYAERNDLISLSTFPTQSHGH